MLDSRFEEHQTFSGSHESACCPEADPRQLFQRRPLVDRRHRRTLQSLRCWHLRPAVSLRVSLCLKFRHWPLSLCFWGCYCHFYGPWGECRGGRFEQFAVPALPWKRGSHYLYRSCWVAWCPGQSSWIEARSILTYRQGELPPRGSAPDEFDAVCGCRSGVGYHFGHRYRALRNRRV